MDELSVIINQVALVCIIECFGFFVLACGAEGLFRNGVNVRTTCLGLRGYHRQSCASCSYPFVYAYCARPPRHCRCPRQSRSHGRDASFSVYPGWRPGAASPLLCHLPLRAPYTRL